MCDVKNLSNAFQENAFYNVDNVDILSLSNTMHAYELCIVKKSLRVQRIH